MNPAKVLIKWFLTAFMVGPEPKVEKLSQKEWLDQILETNPLLGFTIAVGLAMIVLIMIVIALWVFLPDALPPGTPVR